MIHLILLSKYITNIENGSRDGHDVSYMQFIVKIKNFSNTIHCQDF